MPDSDGLPSIKTPWDSASLRVASAGGQETPPIAVPDHALLRRIGRGSYGEVWLARNALGQYRAVKIVHRNAFDNDRPFEREFSGIKQFEPVSRSHESQLNVLHVGRGPDYFYYVMELADDMGRGAHIDEASYDPRNLRSELLLRGRLPVEECIRLGLALTTALEHLHRHGLVHRDIKPSNIVFVNGIPKLADIGLVAQAERTMSFVGTEGYLPPEGPGTVPADLFSLGKVLYEISTGHDRQQFPDLPTNVVELPDRAALAEFNEVIVRACAPDTKQRYQTAAEMHADLALLQSGKSVARMRSVERRLKLVARAGAAVTVLAMLIVAGWLYEGHQFKLVRELATEKTYLADSNARLAAENRERLVRLNVANGIREMDQGDASHALVWLTQALALATNNSPDTAIQRIRIHQLLAHHPKLLRVFSHPAPVRIAEFSPDQRRIATGCSDGSIHIWDSGDDAKPLTEFRQGASVNQLRFIRDCQHLLVTQLNPLLRLERVAVIDPSTGKQVFAYTNEVTSSGLSRDGRWIAVATRNFAIQVLSSDTGEIQWEATGHTDRVEAVSFSSDSTQLLTASRDRTVRRWEVSTGNPIGSPLGHTQPVKHGIFSPDRSRIATATSAEGDGFAMQFQTWDTATGAAVGDPIKAVGSCAALAFDLTGRYLIIGDSEAPARILDADSHQAVTAPLQMGSTPCSIGFSPDGAFVALGSVTGDARVWEIETGRPALPPLHSAGRTEMVQFNGDGTRLITASADGSVKLWDLAEVPDDGRLSFGALEGSHAGISPRGDYAVLSVADSPMYLQLVELEPFKPVPGPVSESSGLAPGFLSFDRNGHQWLAAHGPSPYQAVPPFMGTIPPMGLWRRQADGIRFFPLAHRARVRASFFDADGTRVLTVGDDRVARIWKCADGSLQQAIPWAEKDLAWVAVSPDFHTAVALCHDVNGRHFVFREMQTGRLLGPAPETNPDINAASFSHDGARVATAGDNQHGRIWDARTGQPLTPYFNHGAAITCIDWSLDDRRVLTAGSSPQVKVWDAITGQSALPPLTMKSEPIEGARFSADGRFVVAHSEEKLVRMWDAATGEAVTAFLPHSEYIEADFVTAANQLVTLSRPCVLRVWRLKESAESVRDLSDYASALAGGQFTGPESAQKVGAERLAALFHSLRSRRPDLYPGSSNRLCEWHLRQAQLQEPRTLGQVRAAVFHLERLSELSTSDAIAKEQLQRFRAALIPPRDPATPPQCLDLSRAYTHSFGLLQFQHLVQLPTGRHTLGGCEFDLRGIVQLDHRAERTSQVGPFHPAALIMVRQRCQKLHFLQGAEGGPHIDGSTLARWIMHYADGSTREWPVLYGEQVRDWTWVPSEEPLEANQATVAWRGPPPLSTSKTFDSVRLFKGTWINPLPEIEITSLEYRIGETAMKPLVVAVTAE